MPRLLTPHGYIIAIAAVIERRRFLLLSLFSSYVTSWNPLVKSACVLSLCEKHKKNCHKHSSCTH